MPDAEPPLSVVLLGSVHVRRGRMPVILGPPRQRAIFALLALHAGGVVGTDTLCEAVWDDRAPASARYLIHTYIARLRQALEPHMPPRSREQVIGSAASGYRLLLGGDQVDLVRYRQLAEQGRSHLAAGAWSRAFALLGEAVRLWRDPGLAELGALLPGRSEVDSLRRCWVDTTSQYVTLGLAHGQAATVLPAAEVLAAAEPWHEAIQASYLDVLGQTGHRLVALRHFADLRSRFVTELGVEPGTELSSAHHRLREAQRFEQFGRAGAPVATSAGRSPWRGTGPGLDDLVQRESELASLARTVTGNRMVTLSGPPGCGKSVVALHAAHRLRDRYPDGVAVVDAYGTSDQDGLRARLADLLDARQPGADLVPLLAERAMLIVLDGTEHLVDPCAALVDQIVRTCRGVSVLVTSREPLGLPYEVVRRLAPLPVPLPAIGVRHGGQGSLELFARRAAQVRPGFEVSPANAGQVSAICRGLDGLPLALELAAACLATDSVETLLRKMDNPLQEIRPPRRGGPPYQRTLRDALLRTLDQLSDPERLLFQRLGALPRGFGLADVTPTGVPPDIDGNVRELLASLAHKSLLSVVDDRRRGPRYRMLSLVHRLAVELRAGDPAGPVPVGCG